MNLAYSRPILAINPYRIVGVAKIVQRDKKGILMKRFLSAVFAIGLCFSFVQNANAKSAVPTKTVYFSVGQSKLNPTTKASLSALAKTLKASDSVDVRGFVQVSSSSRNDLRLSTARADNVKAYLVALGVKSKITSKGYGLPKSKRSLSESRRVEIYVTKAAVKPKPTASPSQSQDTIGSISGTIRRAYPYNSCADIRLDYVKLYQGATLIATINMPAWTSTPSGGRYPICDYAYTFQNLPNGTYTVEESFSQDSRVPWGLTNDEQPAWLYLGASDEDLNQIHRIEGLVIAGGADLTGIDLRLRNTD